MTDTTIEQLTKSLREFAKERDWEQFHSPKNIAMALTGEVGELVEHFQWLSEEQSYNPKNLDGVGEEVADVFLYLLRLCDRLKIDLSEVAKRKIELNKQKYPASLVKGSSQKYTDY